MTLYEFILLNEDQQVETFKEHGVYLCESRDMFYKYVLYQISSFYLEVKYKIINNVLCDLRSFTSTIPLEPYLNRIDISSLKGISNNLIF